ncbi:glycosyltransferase [Enterococcus faecium]|uniref:glycosyltransferase n=1 Tax=Enterococcus faecium TaxID=1352 RepID=UPI003D143FFA
MFELTRKRKIQILVIVDSLLVAIANLATYYFMRPFLPVAETFVWSMTILSILLYLFYGFIFKVFTRINRYTNLREMIAIFATTTCQTLTTTVVLFFIDKSFSRIEVFTYNQEDYLRAKRWFHAKSVDFVHGVGLDLKKIDEIEVDNQEKKLDLKIMRDQIILLSVGELNENKNHELVIEGLKNFNNINFKYLICGEGASRERLQSLIKQYKLEDKVELLGFRTDILELLKISDYFIFPSKREGLPVSIMEALACGVPVICSKIRGNSDLVQNNVNGFLFSTDDRESFMHVLTKLLLNKYEKNEVESIKENSIKSVEPYSLENVLNELSEIYSIK